MKPDVSLDLDKKLVGQPMAWLRVGDRKFQRSLDIDSTIKAIDRAEHLWGVTDRTKQFRELLDSRGVSLYDSRQEHHFTGSSIVIDPVSRKILMAFHPWYKLWLQLGGHDEGERDPISVAARETWEESGIDDAWLFDWPVRIDPHPAYGCKAVKGIHANYHYDICYMALAYNTQYIMSNESVAMQWFSLDELKQLVTINQAQQRAFEMARNSLALFDALMRLNKLPV